MDESNIFYQNFFCPFAAELEAEIIKILFIADICIWLRMCNGYWFVFIFSHCYLELYSGIETFNLRMLWSKDTTKWLCIERHMVHLHDLSHSVSNQCYRMLIICSPEIIFSSVSGQNLWLIASNAGHKLLCQIYPFKAVLYLEGKLSPFPHTQKTKPTPSEWGWDKHSAKEGKKKSLWQMNPKLKVFKFTRSL